MNRSVLMLKALIAFLIPGAFVRTLGDAEHALEMSKNEQFRREGTAAQDVHRKEAVGESTPASDAAQTLCAESGSLHHLSGRCCDDGQQTIRAHLSAIA